MLKPREINILTQGEILAAQSATRFKREGWGDLDGNL